MIDVDNKDMSLLPGMTANVTIDVQKAENVLKVPAAALKFMPPMAGAWKKRGAPGDSSRAAAGKQPGDTTQKGHGQWKKQAGEDAGHVFMLAEGKPKFVRVKTGLSNGGFTAVEGEVQPGDQVIVGVLSSGNKTSTTIPLTGGGAPPGMGRRF